MPSTRDALLDAAYDAVVSGDWARVRMADVAAAAGVSRQTLYNEFGSKDALAQALAMREAERFIEGNRQAVEAAHVEGPVAAVAASVEHTLREAADNPLVKSVLTDDGSGMLPFLTTRADNVIATARSSMTDFMLDHWPDLIDRAELELVGEIVTRLTVSYLLLPSDSADASAEAVATRVAHVVERLLIAKDSL